MKIRRLVTALGVAAAFSVPATAGAAPAPRCLPLQCPTLPTVSITDHGQTWVCWSDFSLCWRPTSYPAWYPNWWVPAYVPPPPCRPPRRCFA